MNFSILVIYLARIIVVNYQTGPELIHGQWALMRAYTSDQDRSLKGFWDLYGMDVLIISSDNTICTYSFLEDNPVSCFHYAYDWKEKTINIFRELDPWEDKNNTFSVTLKIIKVDERELKLLYAMYNAANQIYGQLLELHYVSINDFPITLGQQSLAKDLSSNVWHTKEFVLEFSQTDTSNNKYRFQLRNGDTVVGLWHLHNVSNNKLLILSNKLGQSDVYQIKKVSNDRIYLIELNTSKDIVLTTSPF